MLRALVGTCVAVLVLTILADVTYGCPFRSLFRSRGFAARTRGTTTLTTRDQSTGESTRDEGEEDDLQPISGEEQAWYDEMLKNEFVEESFLTVWRGMNRQERREFYQDVMKSEMESGDESDSSDADDRP